MFLRRVRSGKRRFPIFEHTFNQPCRRAGSPADPFIINRSIEQRAGQADSCQNPIAATVVLSQTQLPIKIARHPVKQEAEIA